MKLAALTLALASTVAFADCDLRAASRLATDNEVSNITNLVKTVSQVPRGHRCAVSFDMTVNGQPQSVKGEYVGPEAEDAVCRAAITNARDNFLVGTGGKFKTESVTVCKEGPTLNRKIKIGDTILETEVGISRVPEYFFYRNAKCRLFTERFNQNGQLVVYHGVICQVDNSGADWLVMDKW